MTVLQFMRVSKFLESVSWSRFEVSVSPYDYLIRARFDRRELLWWLKLMRAGNYQTGSVEILVVRELCYNPTTVGTAA